MQASFENMNHVRADGDRLKPFEIVGNSLVVVRRSSTVVIQFVALIKLVHFAVSM